MYSVRITDGTFASSSPYNASGRLLFSLLATNTGKDLKSFKNASSLLPHGSILTVVVS